MPPPGPEPAKRPRSSTLDGVVAPHAAFEFTLTLIKVPVAPDGADAIEPLVVVQNWFDELNRLVPAR